MKYLLLIVFLLLGCEHDAKVRQERAAKEVRDQQMLSCVIMKITTDCKGRIRETYYKCLSDDGIYRLRGYLGNEGDTVKVMRGRMYGRQN